ncbi:MAG: inorganic diphosphatase [Planctomycetota bacterium]|jgi:inorganic pyrophosphatase
MSLNKRHIHIGLFAFFAFLSASCAYPYHKKAMADSENLVMLDQYTLAGEKHLAQGYPPMDTDSNINVVVEIPAGTNAKWEVDKVSGHLKWNFKKGKPRVVSYLAYIGNYGMIPGTILSKESGGDGDPLDVIILGPAIPRGSVVKARLIGVLKLLDKGEQDDKLIAVLPDSPLGEVSNLKMLNNEFVGITNIIELWFSNYKGPGKMVSEGFEDVGQARKILEAAISAYKQNHTDK